MEFGDRLKKAREAKKLTQPSLGEKVGASKQTISHWEKERYEPSLEQLAKLCEVLNTTADHLVLGEATKWPFKRIKPALVRELTPENLAYVEGRLVEALKNCEPPMPPPDQSREDRRLFKAGGGETEPAQTKVRRRK